LKLSGFGFVSNQARTSRLDFLHRATLSETLGADRICELLFDGTGLFGFELAVGQRVPGGSRTKVALSNQRQVRCGRFGLASLGLLAIIVAACCHGVFLSFNRPGGRPMAIFQGDAETAGRAELSRSSPRR
jgi:hypothetical protein